MRAELTAPEDLTLDGAAAAIEGALTARRRSARMRDRSFYDTFDGRVRAAGLILLHEDARLVLHERHTGLERAGHPLRRPARPLLAAELPEGALRHVLGGVAGVRAVMPVARVHTREVVYDVLDEQGKIVVRALLEAPAVVGPDRALTLLRPRAALTAVRGYGEELEAVRGVLLGRLAFTPAERPLVDEAILVAGGAPEGTSSRIEPLFTPGTPAAVAAGRVLGRLLEIVQANLAGTLLDTDTEFLHDLRVAVRRARAVLRELRATFDPDRLEHLRGELRWLQQVTGATRDLDVHLLDWEQYLALLAPRFRGELEPARDALRARRHRALLTMGRALRSPRMQELLEQWSRFALELRDGSGAGGEAAHVPVEEIAGERIRRVYRRMVRAGRAIGPESPDTDLHELRKQGKELRYLFELFAAPLFDPEVVRPLVRALKELQDVLGRHQDRAVQVDVLASLGGELAGAPQAVLALGALAQRLLDDERAAREEFAARFAAFSARGQRRLVRERLR